MIDQFSPPYFFIGLYSIEERKRIEASNRETIATIFKQREAEREQKRRWQQWLKAQFPDPELDYG